MKRWGIGIVGCGNIAGPYAKTLITYPELELLGATEVGQDAVRLCGEKGAPTLLKQMGDRRRADRLPINGFSQRRVEGAGTHLIE